MTFSLVTLEQAKRQLQMDHDADDALIMTQIEQASAITLDFLKLSAVPAEWSGESGAEFATTGADSPYGEVPALIQSAVLLMVGELYKSREAGECNVLSDGIKSLLRRQRHPALA